jgi:hypothetical protein
MTHVELYRKELAYFRADLLILTGDKIEQRCRTLSLLLTAAVRCGEITTTQVRETCRAITPESNSHDVSIWTREFQFIKYTWHPCPGKVPRWHLL